MNGLRATISALMLVSLVILVAAPMGEAQEEFPAVSVLIAGSSTASVNATLDYIFTITGGPAEGDANGTWNYTAELDMKNGTGNPNISSGEESANNVFDVTVTFPAVEQNLDIVVTGQSTLGGETREFTQRFSVKVVKPVVLSADVTNEGVVPVSNMPVAFYINGNEVGRTTVDLSPGESKTVEVNWTTYSEADYDMSVIVDPEGTFLNSDDVSIRDSGEIHVGEESNLMNWLYGGILFLVGFLTFVMVMNARRPQRPGSSTPAKWRK